MGVRLESPPPPYAFPAPFPAASTPAGGRRAADFAAVSSCEAAVRECGSSGRRNPLNDHRSTIMLNAIGFISSLICLGK
ncbi:hypothetical protein JTB14_038028 [Gonioctena quinquepunctata]|nr:hypothetical protein JTB14_038028 [Gonioctena quinquepunctata]